MRHQYRVLSDEEKARMVRVKDLGLEFIRLLHEIGGTDPASDRFASRDLALANTHAEDAVILASVYMMLRGERDRRRAPEPPQAGDLSLLPPSYIFSPRSPISASSSALSTARSSGSRTICAR